MDNKPTVPARDDPNFGPKMKQFRNDVLKLTRSELADKLGMGTTTLYTWEEKGPGTPEPVMTASEGGYAILPPSKRLHDRLVAFVERGETFTKKKFENVSATAAFTQIHPGGAPVLPTGPMIVPGIGLELKYVTEADLVRELKRRGYKVTLEM